MTEGGLPLSELLEKAGDGVCVCAAVSDLPTARTMLPNDCWLCLLVWCKRVIIRHPPICSPSSMPAAAMCP
jgi:hypothetical protein